MLSQGTGRTIKDGDVISVVRKFLVSGVMIDDEYEGTVVGTPQLRRMILHTEEKKQPI